MNEPKRILQIVTHMNRGGLESMIMNYYRKIDRTRFQFDFLVHRDHKGSYDDEIKSLGGNIYHVPNLNPFSPSYFRALRKFFSEHNYNTVHCHLDCMSAYPLKIAKECGIKQRIAHAHSSSQDKDIKYPVKLIARKLIPFYATKLLACGKAAGDWMFSGHEYTIINNAIDTDAYKFSPEIRKDVRHELGIPDDKFVIGHVGRFCKVKNHSFLLEIFEIFQEEHPNSMLLLVGDGELRTFIERAVKERGLTGKVLFTGIRTDVNSLMQAMDVFVFPSIYEGLPVTLVEAQASGLPCYVSDSVPVECNITDKITFVSLKNSAKLWADLIFSKNNNRYYFFDKIKDLGFDVKENIQILEFLYDV